MEPDWHLAEGIITALRAAREVRELEQIMEGATSALGCRFWALVHHEDLRTNGAGRVKIKRYPDQIVERIIGQGQFRRDPVMRACLFSDAAFIWSELPRIIQIDRKDRAAIEFGMSAGLNEGITVPSYLLGDCIGSCLCRYGLPRRGLPLPWIRPDGRHLRIPSRAAHLWSRAACSRTSAAAPAAKGMYRPCRERPVQQGDRP